VREFNLYLVLFIVEERNSNAEVPKDSGNGTEVIGRVCIVSAHGIVVSEIKVAEC
jgi:hypothetical protein